MAHTLLHQHQSCATTMCIYKMLLPSNAVLPSVTESHGVAFIAYLGKCSCPFRYTSRMYGNTHELRSKKYSFLSALYCLSVLSRFANREAGIRCKVGAETQNISPLIFNVIMSKSAMAIFQLFSKHAVQNFFIETQSHTHCK